MYSLPRESRNRGYIGEHFTGQVAGGSFNVGYNISSNPVNVRGHNVTIHLTYDPNCRLTGKIATQTLTNLDGSKVYNIIARGVLVSKANTSINPSLIRIEFPESAYELYLATWNYLYGRTNSW